MVERLDEAIEIRLLRSMPQMQDAVDLQKIYWGEDLNALVPAHMLFSVANYGGHVIGAYDGDRMVGMLLGFLGMDVHEGDDRPPMADFLIMSKRMVVLPEYRGRGIGYALKFAQREEAIKIGIRLVSWTFDPMLSLNAHLNIRKLGGFSRRYVADYFGAEASHPTLSADRLVVEWWVTQRRVDDRQRGQFAAPDLDYYLKSGAISVNPSTIDSDGRLQPASELLTPVQHHALLEVPLDFPSLEADHTLLAGDWRIHVREAFNLLMNNGYIVTDFVRGLHDGRDRAFYVLSHESGFIAQRFSDRIE